MKKIAMIKKRINGRGSCVIDLSTMIDRESGNPEGRNGRLSIRQIDRIHAITGAPREIIIKKAKWLTKEAIS